MKAVKTTFCGIVIAVAAIVLFGGILFGVLLPAMFAPTYEERSRITSRDRKVDAVLVEVNGMLAGPTYVIYIVPAGSGWKGEEKDDAELFSADDVEGMRVRWRGIEHLEITFEKAKIHHFRNNWRSNDVRGAGGVDYLVMVHLIEVEKPPKTNDRRSGPYMEPS